jgi:cytoskeleton protein RodZ
MPSGFVAVLHGIWYYYKNSLSYGGLLVGDILRRKREESGQDLREISNILKIKHDYLKSLEEETFEKLPQEVYVKGYIREYAEYLQIDPESVINAYIQQIAPPPPEQKEIPEKEFKKKKKLKTGYVLILLLFFLIAIPASYMLFQSNEKAETRYPLQTEKEISSPQTETDKKMPASPVVTPQETPESATQQTASLPSAGTARESTPVSPATDGQVLEVFATDTTWLKVLIDKTDSNEMLLKAGESARWHAKTGFLLKIGNAAGVRLVFNGKEMKNLGEKGQVIIIGLPDSRV